MKIIKLFVLSLFCLLYADVYAQVQTTVYDINRNPGNFVNENVAVEGLVTQYVAGTSTTVAHYIIRDDMGAEIQVNTTLESPVTNEKYRITGVVYHENRRLFISEMNRVSLAPAIELPVAPQAEQDNTLLYIVVVIGLLIVLILIYFLYTKTATTQSKGENFNLDQAAGQLPEQVNDDMMNQFMSDSGENTIVIDKEYMTMKALPGKLVILNGEQANKELSLFGAPTPEGQVITIGRDSPDWKKQLKKGREHSHIRIKDSTKTLSRLQAEMVLGNGEMRLRNLGEANPTVVDGVELSVGEIVALKSGSVIQAGNLKLRYDS